jgi:sporulation protein YlmC with PRC-barrel domain
MTCKQLNIGGGSSFADDPALHGPGKAAGIAHQPSEGTAAMTEFTLGATASCTDGFCGVVRRTIVDPATRAVTHLVIEPGHHHHTGGRLVPIGLTEVAGGQIRLRCTLHEFSQLDPAEEVEVVEGGGRVEAEAVAEYGLVSRGAALGASRGLGLDDRAPVVVSHAVPLGESEVGPDDSVHCTDGEIGRVKGFIIDEADGTVTHVLLREGHLWGRKEIAIPVSAVTSVDAGIHLDLTKKEVEAITPRG